MYYLSCKRNEVIFVDKISLLQRAECRGRVVEVWRFPKTSWRRLNNFDNKNGLTKRSDCIYLYQTRKHIILVKRKNEVVFKCQEIMCINF